ncbi:MAG: hypothetical protein F6K56_39790 [Moorea sp. SIO3G5]|nr:hypothetical protein [Moorena sp. SIO3G5]
MSRMWSFGIVMTGSCGLTTVAVFLAALLGKKENTVRQQLREWYRNQQDKKGDKRAELDVTSCFAPLLQWVLNGWPPQKKSMVLALDASFLLLPIYPLSCERCLSRLRYSCGLESDRSQG